jgi:decaprenylphospho-beta-D-erythro-pentofuranosid-2-ulose 2-reductase
MPTVLILGASSDIGYAIARRFASASYDVQLAGRSPQALAAYQSDLQIRYGVRCTLHAFDAADFAAHQSFYQQLNPAPEITVYVIGYMCDNEKALQHWELSTKTIEANYTGAVSMLNIIARDYSEKQKGTIVGISSVAGNRGRQSNFIYGSAKAGFTAYLSGLRNYLYHRNVHVLTVLPGFVYTRMTEHLTLPKLLTAQPEQVADAVYRAVERRKDVLYVKWFWKWIMTIISSIPEGMFKKRKL